MADTTVYPTTHQGVRDLDHPVRYDPSVNVGESERAMSSLGGAVLAGLGAARGGLSGLLLAGLGAALIYRGATGHCSLYAATGTNTAHRVTTG
jgi:uncharacterized membrane protein